MSSDDLKQPTVCSLVFPLLWLLKGRDRIQMVIQSGGIVCLFVYSKERT